MKVLTSPANERILVMSPREAELVEDALRDYGETLRLFDEWDDHHETVATIFRALRAERKETQP